MNSKLLRVLGQIEAGDEASLLCELPKELLDGVKIGPEGCLDSNLLFVLCQKILDEQEALEKQATEAKSFERNQFLMRMIYDNSIAVNPERRAV